ncbi:MAG: glycosyltransferase, partial [Acidobacteria bacterium]|nr:glycosyltransferase [Acidobacteriota bacterium]
MNKNILIFTDSYPYGKAEPFLKTELEYFAHSFENVSVFPLETGLGTEKRVLPEKVEMIKPVFRRIKNKKELLMKGVFNSSLMAALVKEGIRSGAWKSWTGFRIWFTHLLLVRRLSAEIRKRELIQFFNRFDILYFYWGLRWSQIIPFLPEELKPKIITRFHGSDLYEHTNHGYIPWRHQQLERINYAVVISGKGEKYIEDMYPFMKGKTIVSRIGTTDYGLNPRSSSDAFRIVSCSNINAVKRVELIVQALRHTKRNIEWIHFGDGPLKNKVEKLASTLSPNIKWKLAGALIHDELMQYYQNSPVDLFLNVSSSEGVPVSVMEAMSFGIPVIATNVGGTCEIVSEKTGLLIDKDFAPELLAQKIEEMAGISDPEEARK